MPSKIEALKAACKPFTGRFFMAQSSLTVVYFFRVHVVAEQAVFGHLGVFAVGAAVIAIRVDGEAAARGEFAPHFDVARIQQGD